MNWENTLPGLYARHCLINSSIYHIGVGYITMRHDRNPFIVIPKRLKYISGLFGST